MKEEVIGKDRREMCWKQGVTKRCRLSWLTNSALVNDPKCCIAHEAQINFGDLTPF